MGVQVAVVEVRLCGQHRRCGVLGERIDAAIIAVVSRIRRPSIKNSRRKPTLSRMWHPRHPGQGGTLGDRGADDLQGLLGGETTRG